MAVVEGITIIFLHQWAVHREDPSKCRSLCRASWFQPRCQSCRLEPRSWWLRTSSFPFLLKSAIPLRHFQNGFLMDQVGPAELVLDAAEVLAPIPGPMSETVRLEFIRQVTRVFRCRK